MQVYLITPVRLFAQSQEMHKASGKNNVSEQSTNQKIDSCHISLTHNIHNTIVHN